jgi:biopolymer transport protein ExbD
VGKIKQTPMPAAGISTASMPDIIFMLLIFFMVVTSFKQFDGLPVIVPEAKTTQKIAVGKRDISYIWADQHDRVMLNDQLFAAEQMGDLSEVLYTQRSANPKLVISFKADRATRMKVITDVQQECRKAYALRVNYSTRFKN